jgi:uncharacterized protein (TIGR02246 family)
MEQGDANRWIALWEPDGVQMTPGAPTRYGSAAILEGMRGSMSRGTYSEVTIQLEEARADGDIGYARGNAQYIFTQKSGGGSGRLDAKYLTIFRRQRDGTWKVHCDCVNLNTP